MRSQCSLLHSSYITWSNLFLPYLTLVAALSTRCNLLIIAREDPAKSMLQLSTRETTKQFTSDFAASIGRLLWQLLMHHRS